MTLPLDDQKIKQSLQEGDRAAFSDMFRTYFPSMFHYGMRIIPHEVSVEEAIHDIFLYLLEHPDKAATIDSMKAYLFVSLKRRLIRNRKKTLHVIHLEGAEVPDMMIFSPEDFMIAAETNEDRSRTLADSLNLLSLRQREAIYLRYYNNLSTQEMAALMEISPQTVLNTLHKAIKKLREEFKTLPTFFLAFISFLVVR